MTDREEAICGWAIILSALTITLTVNWLAWSAVWWLGLLVTSVSVIAWTSLYAAVFD